jgi:5,10-methylenetetrahydrofolate reductase
LFEPVPPAARSPPARVTERVDRVAEILGQVPRIDAINVPELIDENHDGRPYYRSLDPRAFALEIVRRTSVPAIVNRVVAHVPSAGLARWAEETVESGIHQVVLVGGTSRYIPYPGPSVPEANRLLRPIFERHAGMIGNIAIPQREMEAHRLLAKTRSGASFFTTQLLFDAAATVEMVRGYDRLCRASGVVPRPVLASFGPLADDLDAEFVRWLGADLSEAVEHTVLGADDGKATERSCARALEVWTALDDAAAREHWSVPLGANVEQVSVRHLDAAAALLQAFARQFGSERAAGGGSAAP